MPPYLWVYTSPVAVLMTTCVVLAGPVADYINLDARLTTSLPCTAGSAGPIAYWLGCPPVGARPLQGRTRGQRVDRLARRSKETINKAATIVADPVLRDMPLNVPEAPALFA